ncbi:peptidylprolyl isomerase [Actinoplanes xinjiangensis]|uniref:Peptidyl-prolyl cis-trans isomerase n=1 Tax=Actinoplanes xinjiangensis TaxID=512350 RepID=A0A316F9Y7_9ACTN|nr:peptidylprolyl isomerase [Actinoplanes xinjiangensis]
MSYRRAVPESSVSRDSAAVKRAVAGPPRKNAGGPPLKTKAEKRAEAKVNRARARAMQKRRQALSVAGAALAVVAVVVGLALWITTTPTTEPTSTTPAASTDAGAAPEPSAAFPNLPAGADPALAKKPATTAGTGKVTELKVTPLIEGTGAAVEAGQTIEVNYVGVTYTDGKEFDASWKRSEAFSFQVGAGNVIPGWDKGLVGVKVGSRVQLDIPADMAYGDNPGGGRPAGALRFIVDVLSAS